MKHGEPPQQPNTTHSHAYKWTAMQLIIHAILVEWSAVAHLSVRDSEICPSILVCVAVQKQKSTERQAVCVKM